MVQAQSSLCCVVKEEGDTFVSSIVFDYYGAGVIWLHIGSLPEMTRLRSLKLATHMRDVWFWSNNLSPHQDGKVAGLLGHILEKGKAWWCFLYSPDSLGSMATPLKFCQFQCSTSTLFCAEAFGRGTPLRELSSDSPCHAHVYPGGKNTRMGVTVCRGLARDLP